MRRIFFPLATFLAFSSLAQAISLADFIPLLQGLPAACDAAYRAAIPGCVAGDFEPPYVCSQSCLNGLIQTNGQVTTACKGVSVNPQSIVGLFLMGDGIQALCNVAVVTKTTGTIQPVAPATATSSIINTSNSPIIFATSAMTSLPAPRSTITMISSMSSSSSSKSMAPVSLSSSTLKTMTSKSSSSAKATASAAAQKQNPSVPNCSNRGSTGSPFDSFTDQTCEKISRASAKRLSPFAAVIGFMFVILLS